MIKFYCFHKVLWLHKYHHCRATIFYAPATTRRNVKANDLKLGHKLFSDLSDPNFLLSSRVHPWPMDTFLLFYFYIGIAVVTSVAVVSVATISFAIIKVYRVQRIRKIGFQVRTLFN